MRKDSTTRSDRRARVSSSGGIFMIVCYVTLKGVYIEHLRLTCPQRKGMKKFQCLFA